MSTFSEYLSKGLIVGYGTYQIKDPAVLDCAIESGYNFFDTAQMYKNEDIVIDLVKKHRDNGRTDLFVSTKLSYIMIEKGKIEESFRERLEKFNGVKINLLLLHKPSGDCARDWKTLCKLYLENKDKIEHIGVSNYDTKHLDLIEHMEMMPFCNQIEITPFYTRKKLVKYCEDKGIVIISHTSLTRGNKLNDTRLKSIAERHNMSVAKLLLVWACSNNFVTIPRSSNKEHMLENVTDVDYTTISPDDMNTMNNDMDEMYYLTKVMF